MERQYSVEFFSSFVENLQQLCQKYLDFSQFVEVSGYISVEIDNAKKERYVLSELVQSSGNVVSESYCIKAFETMHSVGSSVNISEGCGDVRTEIEKKPRMGCYGTLEASTISYSTEVEPSMKIEPPNEMVSYVDYQSNAGPSSRNLFQETTNLTQERVSFPQKCVDVPHDHIRLPQECVSFPQKCVDVPHEHIRLPQKRPRQGSQSRSTVSSQSDCPTSPTDSVIDLDLIDDDLDLPMDESGQEDTSFNDPQQLTVSTFPIQKKPAPSVLSPASLTTTMYTVRQFTRFHFNRSGQKQVLLSLLPDTLDNMLTQFYIEAKKVNGGDLKPRSLQNVQTCLNRYLKDGGYPYSILKDKMFQGSRETLKKRVAEIVSENFYLNEDNIDVNLLFKKGLLGCCSGEVLINTMWFINTIYFKKKSNTEHFNMKWGDVVFNVDDDGLESIACKVDGAYRKVYAEPENPDRCLIEFYKQYMIIRPNMVVGDKYPFYLKVTNDVRESVFLPRAMSVVELDAVCKRLIVASKI